MKARAFTLVELIVVLAIVAVLTTVGFVSYFSYVKNGNDFKRIADVTLMKNQLETYKQNHGLQYPEWSNSTLIKNGSTTMAKQSTFDEALAGALEIEKVFRDPRTGSSYLYSVKADHRSYQIAATVEDLAHLAYEPSFWIGETAYAASIEAGSVAYVVGSFIPADKTVFPGLLYSVVDGQPYDPKTILTYDISGSGVANAILNGNRTNFPYDTDGNMVANKDNMTIGALLASVSLVQTSASVAGGSLSCTGVYDNTQTIYAGENDVWPYMAGDSIGTQIGWKYKTCNGTSGQMEPNTTVTATDTDWKYVCANIAGATFDASCHWTGCNVGYSPVTGASAWAPKCRIDFAAPTLAYPSNGAYGVPLSMTLAWNAPNGGDGNYKVYVGSANGTWNTINGAASTVLTYALSGLSAGNTYYWKINACEAGNATNCKDSEVRSFTATSPTVVASGTTVTTPANTNCPTEPEVPCYVAAGTVTMTYVGCSNVDSTVTDCGNNSDSFGTSDRDLRNDAALDSYYGRYKVVSYRLQNNADGSAYFKVKLGTSTSTLVDVNSTDNFNDSTNAIDFWGEWIARNLYWKAGAGCYTDATKGYKILGKSSCWINVYGRSDRSWPTTPALGIVGAIQAYNTDTVGANWTPQTIPINGMGAGFSNAARSSPVTLAYASNSKQALDTSVDAWANNFGTSTRIGTNTYGYWKSLTYTVTNPNSATAYFRVGMSPSGTVAFATGVVAPSTGSPDTLASYDLTTNSGKVVDVGNNATGNIIWKNGDLNGSGACATSLPSSGGFLLPAAGSGTNSCQFTLYSRGDAAYPTAWGAMMTLSLQDQAIGANTLTQQSISAKGFAWWIYFTQNILSETLGYISMNISIQDYNMPTYKIYGDMTSEVIGNICILPSCWGSLTRNPTTGKLDGYGVSEMLGYVNFSGVTFTDIQTTAGTALSELFGYISFN